MKFQKGEFRTLVATRPVSIGGDPGSALEKVGLKLSEGDEIEFDGVKLRYAGEEYAAPQLRAAVQHNILVEVGEYDEDHQYRNHSNMSAGIKARKAQIQTAYDNTREALETESMEMDREVARHEFKGKGFTPKRIPKRTPDVLEYDEDEYEKPRVQETERPLFTSTKTTFTLTGSNNPVPQEAPTLKTKGILSEDSRPRRKRASREDTLDLTEGEGGSVQVVGRMKRVSRSRDENIEIHDTAKAPLKPSREVMDSASAKRRLKVARQMCDEFPDSYDFSQPENKRLARLTADFDSRHDVILAVFAAETDSMKELIAEEFPAVFE